MMGNWGSKTGTLAPRENIRMRMMMMMKKNMMMMMVMIFSDGIIIMVMVVVVHPYHYKCDNDSYMSSISQKNPQLACSPFRCSWPRASPGAETIYIYMGAMISVT